MRIIVFFVILLQKALGLFNERVFRGSSLRFMTCLRRYSKTPIAIGEPVSSGGEVNWAQQSYLIAASARWGEEVVAAVQNARWSHDAISIVASPPKYHPYSQDFPWTSKAIQTVCNVKWSSELIIASCNNGWGSEAVEEICKLNWPQDVLLAAAKTEDKLFHIRALMTSNRSHETTMAIIDTGWCNMVYCISTWTDAMVLAAIDSNLSKLDVNNLVASGWRQSLVFAALNATKTVGPR